MRRFYIHPEQLDRAEPRITGKDVRHIRDVLRLSPGDTIRLLDGSGRMFDARIAAFEENAVRVALLNRVDAQNESALELIVAQGFLKDRKMDDLVRQITELGATRWIPMTTERTVARPDAKRMEKRVKRWRAIAVEAVKQCGRSMVPEIESMKGFKDVLGLAETVDLPVFFWERATAPMEQPPETRPASVLLVLGPEGGFTEAEAGQAEARGLRLATLGPRILRAETAALTTAALAQYLFGDLQKSP
ncbi:MAG: 16S rRNA (uracil(1498)-N(3))-methyltransferase [Desulfobacteraceae bacterium]|nr:16S rRNA (uracil(1498)-N(3))-methyltransferase [Desulfobacteraceae bacterium]